MKHYRRAMRLTALLLAVVLAGCGGRAYVHEAFEPTDLRGRAEIRTEGTVRVSAAVPGREETGDIFGLPLYDQGIQPVWIEIENTGPRQVRYALSSTDRFYFTPHEIAWKNRGGYSNQARTAMERRLSALAMPRHVPPGETRSGFVYTHADTGAKGFNVDVFDSDTMHNFTYLLRVPGFTPDYANLDFEAIYEPGEVTVYDLDSLYEALKTLPCCTSDAQGNQSGEPVNVILVGKGIDILKALLRSNWVETSAEEAAGAEPTFLFGRPQDAVVRYKSRFDDGYYELRAWLAPVMSGDDRVWAGQVRHFFKRSLPFMRVDPDVDNARNFALQNFMYGQALAKLAWISGPAVVAPETFWEKLIPIRYFTDGYRIVVWPSPDPVSLLDVEVAEWEDPPGWKR